ncbi:MAG: low molecular weight protein-tyrosine-phosphatase [Bacteroidota bacterium]
MPTRQFGEVESDRLILLMVKVLFVCLGNICRSPMAEGLFLHHMKAAGLSDQIEVDSAGTGGWHVGEPADRRMQQVAKSHGVDLPSRARKVRFSDFTEFDYILAMDHSNFQDLEDLARETPNATADLILMRHFDEVEPDSGVPDPYYGGAQGFENVYQMLDRSTLKLLEHIRAEQKI